MRRSQDIPTNSECVSPGAKLFGSMLKSYREREGLSLRKVAARLGVSESGIYRLEEGQRNPPLNNKFYHRLYDLPGISTLEIQTMLDCDGAPEWFKEIRRERMQALHPCFAIAYANAQGISLTIEIVPVTQQARDELSKPGERGHLLKFLKRATEEIAIPNALQRLEQQRASRKKIAELLRES